jgi:6-phosphogluconolactonase
MTMTPSIEILPDPESLARRAADLLLMAAKAAQGHFAVADSGGATPRRLYELMGQAPYRDLMPWDRVHVFWGDERFVPHSDVRSNYRMAQEALLSHVPIEPSKVHPMPTEGLTPGSAALAYERRLKSFYGAERLDPERPLFDVTLLGLGEDGHMASLFPGTSALMERERWVVAVTDGPFEPRMTLTYPALESSRLVLFLVAGTAKRTILSRVLGGDRELPATRLRPLGRLVWLADAAAAKRE